MADNEASDDDKEVSRLDQLDFPCGVAVESDGSVIVADQNNHRCVRWRKGADAKVCSRPILPRKKPVDQTHTLIYHV